MPSLLPKQSNLDIGILCGIFSDTTNSYKYLFFLSILDILKRNNFNAEIAISFSDIAVEMLAIAWYPHTYFKLSFGKQDKLTEKLDSLPLEISEPILKFTDTDKTLLRQTIGEQNLREILAWLKKNVPYRLIRPFFEKELTGIHYNHIYKHIPKLAIEKFDSRKPIYKFNHAVYSDCSTIILHSEWVEYIKLNYSIVYAWVSWEWLEYMQPRNPSVPAISRKLFAPPK